LSDELKAWIKRTQRTELHGPDFIRSLTPDDVMDVPEFKEAYVNRNLIMVGLGFPRYPKAGEKQKDPAKYEEAVKRYWAGVRAYVEAHPESKEQMDDHLVEVNPGPAWRAKEQARAQLVRQKMEQLIHSRYLAARAETDYEGLARISGLAPGRYWLTNLWTEVRAGDVKLRWEVPLELRPGQALYLELNNANSLPR
jgi:acyl-homoserine lactone acylase PvdQ